VLAQPAQRIALVRIDSDRVALHCGVTEGRKPEQIVGSHQQQEHRHRGDSPDSKLNREDLIKQLQQPWRAQEK